MIRLTILLGILQILAFSSCISQQNSSAKDEIKEGLSGKVVWREGNFMPTIDGSSKNKSIGISREILIYELTNTNQTTKEDAFFTDIKTKLIKRVTSNPDGTFKVELNPGKYSIFSKEEEGLFANGFDGENNIAPVTVEEGKVTEITVIIDYKAAY